MKLFAKIGKITFNTKFCVYQGLLDFVVYVATYVVMLNQVYSTLSRYISQAVYSLLFNSAQAGQHYLALAHRHNMWASCLHQGQVCLCVCVCVYRCVCQPGTVHSPGAHWNPRSTTLQLLRRKGTAGTAGRGRGWGLREHV